MKTVTRIAAIVWMALLSATWAGQPPASLTMVAPYINYQGRLVTTSNTPYADALHIIDLALYPPASNTKLWNERYFVQTRDGYFSVNLGSGGTALLLSNNVPIWNVLWKTNASDPDTFFMGLTVRTDQAGKTNSTPVEATPRQQFLSTPFAMRSMQSTYASKADGVFEAPQGVSTTALMKSGTNNVITVNADIQVNNGIKANSLYSPASPNILTVNTDDGVLYMGYFPTYGGGAIYSKDIYLGAPVNAFVSGSDVQIAGKSVDIVTTNLTVSSLPMFEWNNTSATVGVGVDSLNVNHGMDTTQYEVYIVGWYASLGVPGVKWMKVYSGQAYAQVRLTAAPTSSSSISIDFLGIRKGLIKKL